MVSHTQSEVTSTSLPTSPLRLPPLLMTLLKRLGWGLLTLWGVSVIVFVLLFVLPRLRGGDPADAIAQTMAGNHSTKETIENIKKDRGLDQPLLVQYTRFVTDALTNNLKSYRNKALVMNSIWHRFPATLLLALAGLTVWLVVAIPLGLMTGEHAGSWLDRSALWLGLIAISVPTFFLGRLLQHFLGYEWGLFSVGGSAKLWNLPLPAMTLGLGGAAYYSRLLHTNLRSVLTQDYIRAARARGLSEGVILGKHALKNALIPMVTILGMDIASLLSGLIFTEKIFGWPGIGSLAVDSVLNLDPPMIMGTVLFSALMVVIMNLIVDIAYHLIDPRVRLGD
ncbi:MAG: ABC transporter permease [Abitibacteriaceae bacterium]|nr:ABC transporter permease [Abditibacteriaceae bacterium]